MGRRDNDIDRTEDLNQAGKVPDSDKTEDLARPESPGSDKTEDLGRPAEEEADATMASETPTEAPPRPSELPQTIGSYPIVEELGHGGMGVVYIAEDPVLERRIALKVLPDRLAQDATAFSRFQSEAKLLAAMNHPNIATIHSLEESDGVHFLTMELIDGRELGKFMDHTPTVDEWLSICRQVAAALEAHALAIAGCGERNPRLHESGAAAGEGRRFQSRHMGLRVHPLRVHHRPARLSRQVHDREDPDHSEP
jgi:serine/threonine protein kinase